MSDDPARPPHAEAVHDRLADGRARADEHLGPGTTARWSATSPALEELTSGFFGEVWGRPGLDRRTRSIIAMTATATLRAHPQLAWHVHGALRAGVTPDEVRETILAVAGFAGFPAAWQGIEVAESAIAEHGTSPGREAEAGTP